MSSEIAIKVENLSKCYYIYDQPRDRLKQFILPRLQRLAHQLPKQYCREFWALKDVSFEVRKGETVGIVGRNGSGKSTLLQMICGTLNPTSGTVQTAGRIAALLELGSGFNPEFSGRENVYLSGTILGLSQEEIDARFDDIAAFADIGDFIEQPVKTYSSGMFVRLAFSVNIISNPEIMIVDEALAVGDMNFQARCMSALTRIQDQGATVLFVSHDVGALKSLCSQAIYLEHGRVIANGPAPIIAEQYVRSMREEMNAEVRKFARVSNAFPSSAEGILETDSRENSTINLKTARGFKRSNEFDRRVAAFRYGSGDVRITYAELLDLDGNSLQSVSFNQDVKILIYFEANTAQQVSISFNILDDKKINLVGCGFSQVAQDFLKTSLGMQYLVEYQLKLPFSEGIYSIRTQITSPVIPGQSAEFIDVIEDAIVFRVLPWDKAPIWSKVHLFPTVQVQAFLESK